jgi:pre-rRNA-processing protein IPI1
MGSSVKKKKEKKKDFQASNHSCEARCVLLTSLACRKQNCELGRLRLRPTTSQIPASSQSVCYANCFFYVGKQCHIPLQRLTDAAIVVNTQSLSTTAPALGSQLYHYISLASSSRSDTQRRDALSYLINQFTSQPVNTPFPVSPIILLDKLIPLLLDGSASVRSQLLKLLRLLPASEINDRAEPVLLYIRAGLTHLAAGITIDALAALEWLLEVASDDAVSCPGGWFKTVKCFLLMLGWSVGATSTGWTTSNASFGKTGKPLARQLLVFAQFLKTGLINDQPVVHYNAGKNFPLWDVEAHMIPTRSNAYARLNLFGSPRDEEGEMYMDVDSRQRVFHAKFQSAVDAGIAKVKKEAGEAGRAAAVLAKVVRDGMAGYSGVNDTL